MNGNYLENNFKKAKANIERALLGSKDPKRRVLILAVSKKQSLETVKGAFQAGLRDFGENYVQEFLSKREQLNDYNINWHFIGHLQKNKVNKILGLVGLIHSVDSLSLLQEISKRSLSRGGVQDILIQVNIAQEETKGGVKVNELPELIEKAQHLRGICLRGLMVMPPLDRGAEYFEQTKILFEQIKEKFPQLKKFDELSMGTSHDYEQAVRAGATIVRLGTSLLGSRGA